MDNINDDEESKEFYCEVIVDEARKMNQMVKKIMDLNQLEFGYNTVTMEHFDIIAMIRAVIAKSDILLRRMRQSTYGVMRICQKRYLRII